MYRLAGLSAWETHVLAMSLSVQLRDEKKTAVLTYVLTYRATTCLNSALSAFNLF